MLTEDISNLQENSPAALDHIQTYLGVDISKTSRLGGHSVSRTHSNPAGPNVGFAIMKAVLDKVKELPNVQLVTAAPVKDISWDAAAKQFTVAYDSKAGEPGETFTNKSSFESLSCHRAPCCLQ
jgi:hypothetical protein